MANSDRAVGAARRNLLLFTFVLASLVYALTCAPGVVWQDSATFQYRVWFSDYHGELGLALAHPLYIALAKFFSLLPISNHAFRVNLFSGFCAAFALLLLADLLLTLTRSRLAAVVGVLLLGVSHTFWKHAVVAEVMTLYGLWLVAELWLLERFFREKRATYLVAALFVNGLNTSNHMLAGLHVPAYAVLILWALHRRRIQAADVAIGLAAYLAGLAPYLAIIAGELTHGRPLRDTLHSALFGDGFENDVLNTSFSLSHQAVRTVEYFVLNFPTPLLLAAPIGWLTAWRNPAARWLAAFGGGIFVVAFIFAFRYPVADQYVFFLPCYILWAAFTGPAVAHLVRRSSNRAAIALACALLPAAFYEVVPHALRRYNVAVPFRRDIPFRDAYAYYLRPRMNGDHSAERFARAALSQAAPAGLLIADFTVKTALVYVRDVLGVERGVTLDLPCDLRPAPPVIIATPQEVRPFAERGAAYIATNSPAYVPDWILKNYDLVPAGVIFQLQPEFPFEK